MTFNAAITCSSCLLADEVLYHARVALCPIYSIIAKSQYYNMLEIHIPAVQLDRIIKHLKDLDKFDNRTSTIMIQTDSVQMTVAKGRTRIFDAHISEYPTAVICVFPLLVVSDTILIYDIAAQSLAE